MAANGANGAGGGLDAVVVGAGFAGLYMLHRLRALGLKARAVEAGGGVGGTWYWNRYPGARCDIESMEYSYQFSEELQQEWEWTERFATQPEILSYLNHVADRFDLRRDIVFDTRVTAAHYDEARARWRISTDRGAELDARYFIMATGCLSSANMPRFRGQERFSGPIYHTGRWPHEGVDFAGLRVGVIGTGSSGVQSIPVIAREAAHLTVFQRTPTYAVPAHNAPLDPAYVKGLKARYREFRERNNRNLSAASFSPSAAEALKTGPEERERVFEDYWQKGGLGFLGAFGDLITSREANETAGAFVRGKIRAIVNDPELAERLSPHMVLGCKRLCVDTGYYETYNRDNVRLVDIGATPIEAFTERGILTSAEEIPLDAVVCATGFDAMTGAVMAVDIRGRKGVPIQEAWAEGPKTYLGLQVAGFPNLFLISGPGSPSVLTNMVPSIEQHVNFIADCLAFLGERQIATIEAEAHAQEAWVAHVNEVADASLFPTCNSWYLGANVPGKPRVFMPLLGFPPYVEKCEEVAAKGYEGFALSPRRAG